MGRQVGKRTSEGRGEGERKKSGPRNITIESSEEGVAHVKKRNIKESGAILHEPRRGSAVRGKIGFELLRWGGRTRKACVEKDPREANRSRGLMIWCPKEGKGEDGTRIQG